MLTLRNIPAGLGALALAALALAGCGSDRTPSHRARAGANPAAGVVAPGAAGDPSLNAAVSLSSAANLFGLKFRLAAAPVVGKAGAVDLVVVPTGNVPLERVHVSLRAGEGLRLLTDSSMESAETAAGEALRYEVQFVPDTAGVLTLGVTLVVDSENDSLSRTYTIPLIAQPAKG